MSRVAALLLKVTRLKPGRISGPIKTGKPGEPNQMRRIRLVIADRRPIVLQGFATLFATERDFEIVASCINGADCLEAVRTLAPDVALVEDGFPDLTASAMLTAVNTERLPTRLVFYTASIARGDLAAAVAAGACTAIPMREEPENLLQSLRLVAPAADRKTGSRAFGENSLAALTDQEHKIIRLAASGMSNKEIARQIKVAPARVEARIEQISAQLGIKNRTELARFALSRLYGGVGALAALIWAVLDDLQSANAAAADHAGADNVTVMTADGTGAVVTIKITSAKTTPAPGKMARAVRIESSPTDMPTRAAKLIESRADIAGSTITVPPLNPARPGLSSAGTFMMTAVGVSLLSSHAQAFTAWERPSDVFAWADANAPRELVALDSPGRPDLDGFDKLPWLDPDTHHESFALEAARGDAMARADEVQIIDAAAREDGFGDNGNPHIGSGAIDALSDHGGLEQAAATGARNAERGTTQAAAIDARDHGQAQRDLHASEDGAAAGKPETEHGPPDHASSQGKSHASEKDAAAGNKHAELGPPEGDFARGQSQRDLHGSENGAAAGKHQDKQGSTGHDSHHGQSDHASEPGSAAAKQLADDDGPASHANSGESQRDLHQAHPNASQNPHAEPGQKADGHDPANHGAGAAQAAAAPGPGDSFHFRNDMPSAKGSDHRESGYGTDTAEHGPHRAGHPELSLIPDADLIGHSHAEQSAVDHARGVEHHPVHDWFV
ncbi:LuxR C-terminal-related transcriptional regulator [Bradyrhizobium yuanmingense]|uniref:LuxR C-terminal-related transcriptional regulator n=1 Tax=Bradyrhizobium yuanmingense TaxID=108015 RepID=UPI0021A6144C|nr:LuxR C-terminal-related transcriptional regulator [Bradyrhizobium sp. CB1024]UWU85198.1 LuxR C-terminal-related transcriptional regulator [Bradyrhizobium sp. CB1024]